LGIVLPRPVAAIANYVGFVRTGRLLFLSGQLCLADGVPVAKGKLGRQVTVEEGQAAARTCAINLLAQVKVALGDLDHVVRVVRLGGFMVPMRGYNPPPFPPLSGHGDLAVVGPMTRTAADLALALDVVAGPDEEHAGIGYRLALPPARHNNLKSFRVLVIDSHPLMPTGTAVRTAIGRLSERLAKAGVKVARASKLLPDLADSARLYMRLLASAKSASLAPDRYEETQRSTATLAPGDDSLEAQRTRGTVMSHRDWITADVARVRLQQQWSLFFREWDIVLYPPAPVPAFPHDRRLRRDILRSMAKDTPSTMHVLCGRTPPPHAASPRPRRPSIVRRSVCRSGCKSSDLILRIARRSPLLNFLNGSSAVSYRLRGMRGDSQLVNAPNAQGVAAPP
jgi:hypothetical protein